MIFINDNYYVPDDHIIDKMIALNCMMITLHKLMLASQKEAKHAHMEWLINASYEY